MRGRENNPAKAVWPKQSDLNKVWRALNNIKIHGQKGTAVLHENGINISLKPQRMAVADVGGKVVTSGVISSCTITLDNGTQKTGQELRLLGLASSQSFTFPSGVEILAVDYGYVNGGTWTRGWFGVWPYSMTDFDATKNQAYIHEAGAFKWLELGCAE